MYNRIDVKDIADLFVPISQRSDHGVFFLRICRTNQKVQNAVWQFHEAARSKGVILEGQISNPDERQLSFFSEMMGPSFQATPSFVTSALQKWMPRMQQGHRAEFARSLCAQFDELRKKGKTDSILRNIYIKLMCWLYFKFERLVPYLGQDNPPRILYAANGITAHELVLLRILSAMGADILLLELTGDQPYLKQDAASVWSQLLSIDGKAFPPDFSLKQFRKEMAAQSQTAAGGPARQPMAPPVRASTRTVPVNCAKPVQAKAGGIPTQGPAGNQSHPVGRPVSRGPQPCQRNPEAYFPKPSRSGCTNAWMKEASYTEILTPIVSRGNDTQLFYHALIRVRGVFDKLTYLNELFQFYQQFKSTGRNIVIVNDELSLPAPEEIVKIRRRSYRTEDELIIDLAGNLPSCANVELQRLMQQAFVQAMKIAAQQEKNINKLVVSAVYLLCWIHRYQSALFHGYKGSEISCFVLMGGCKNQHDALYLQYLSRLPVDILILACDLNRVCSFSNDRLLELTGEYSLPVPKFPVDTASLQTRTLASNAEQELNAILYTDSGMYRNRQFAKADAITLRTTYDEIFLLWNEELRYRPGFDTANQTVSMPVIFTKISGIEQGKTDLYWQKIKTLLGSQTKLFRASPFCPSGNAYQSLAVKSIKNGKLRRDEIRTHRQYPFGLLREELQEHIFDKLQLMLDRKLIKGTFVNGTEYTIVATILNLEKDLIRMLQSFDFTKRNPKVVAILAGEQACSLEEAILLTFLNLIGFDVALFVPTGYQTIERFLNEGFPIEHQIGEYAYDLLIPDFQSLPSPKSRSWLDNILKRGN